MIERYLCIQLKLVHSAWVGGISLRPMDLLLFRVVCVIGSFTHYIVARTCAGCGGRCKPEALEQTCNCTIT